MKRIVGFCDFCNDSESVNIQYTDDENFPRNLRVEGSIRLPFEFFDEEVYFGDCIEIDIRFSREGEVYKRIIL